MRNLFIPLCLTLNKLCGRSATKGEKVEPISTTLVNPPTQIDCDQWRQELNVGKRFTAFKPYDTGETLEEMELRHKREIILNAQNQHISEQLKYIF